MIELIAGLGAGTLLGAAYFGGLWLTVRRVLDRASPGPLALVSYLLRLGVLGAGLWAVVRLAGVGALFAALVGILMVRHLLIRRLAPGAEIAGRGRRG